MIIDPLSRKNYLLKQIMSDLFSDFSKTIEKYLNLIFCLFSEFLSSYALGNVRKYKIKYPSLNKEKYLNTVYFKACVTSPYNDYLQC